jgi:DNA (cytosine-5)-methyltransferase 1
MRNKEYSNGKYTAIDLFSGAGGLSEGFEKAGISIISAVECWEPAIKTYSRNFPSVEMIRGKIGDDKVNRRILKIKEKIDIIIGGVPCQGFSLSGNRDPLDPRGRLYEKFLRIVDLLRPPLFLMENVKGLKSMKTLPDDLPQKDIKLLRESLIKLKRFKDLKRYKAQRKLNYEELIEFDNLKKYQRESKNKIYPKLVYLCPVILKKIKKISYIPYSIILNSVYFGSPQFRERIFIIGIRNDINTKFKFPKTTCKNFFTVKNAIGDLENIPETPLINHIFTKHKTEFIERLHNVMPGTTLYPNYSDAWYRLVADKPARTVKENHGGVFIHYKFDRVLTPRELARLQDFKDDFIFEGSKSSILTQIGNAVPCKLSKAMANSVRNFLKKCSS